MNKKLLFSLLFLFSLSIYQCGNDDSTTIIDEPYTPTPTTPVEIDLTKVPYQKLSDYKLFEGELKEMKPSFGVHPYNLNSQLFTDYASKQRFIWMPKNSSAEFVSADKVLQFPQSTVLVKTFYYNNSTPSKKIIETRIMIKKGTGSDDTDEWIFANYIWNEEQTEAYLDMNGSYVDVSFINEYNDNHNIRYRIPSETECLICHKENEKAIPIGPKPYNMDINYAYSSGAQNQMQYWIDNKLINDNFSRNYTKLVNWKDTSQATDERLRSYLEINCAHCHAENKHCDYRPIRLGFLETISETNVGVCVTPQESVGESISSIISPRNISKSAMHFRLNSSEDGIKMPLLGRSIVDKEAVALLEQYINSLETTCN